MELLLFSSSLEFLETIDTYLSLRWHRRFYNAGEFELHIPYSERLVNKIKFDCIIGRRDAKEAGIIESIAITDDKDNSEKIIIKGRFLSSLLSRRCIVGTWNLNGAVSAEMYRLVKLNCITPTDQSRAIPLLALSEQMTYPETITAQVTDKELLEQLSIMSMASNIGFGVYPDYDAKKMCFGVYKGVNYSIEQQENPYRIFSDDFENLSNSNYETNSILTRNTVYVAGEGEGEARKRITIAGGTGLERREICVDARDLTSKDITESEYISLLTQRGNEKLAECKGYEQFEAEVITTSNLKYKTHWDLGDIVTVVKKRWNVLINQKIVEVTEIYEDGEVTITPIFGTPIPKK